MLMISYQPLWNVLDSRGMDRKALEDKGCVNHTNYYKLLNDEPVSMPVLMKICDLLSVPVESVVVFKEV